jgi:SAM-dependent methyltransferase
VDGQGKGVRMDNHSDDLGMIRWDESYKLQTAETLWGEVTVPFLELAIGHFRSTGAAYALDFPCGDGRHISRLSADLPFVIGSDSSTQALRIAASRARKQGLSNVAFLQDDVLAPRFQTGTVPAIFCCDVLGHLKQARTALCALVHLLSPGGIIVGNVFASGDSTRHWRMEQISADEGFFDNRFYFRFYERSSCEDLLDGLGVEVLDLHLARWTEPGHEGYREHEHEHESWVFALRKEG